MYKVLYTRYVIANVRYFSSRVEIFELKHNSQVSFSINIERDRSFLIYKYRRVLYQPLKRQEALRCLKYFVSKTMVAVQNFHELELAHLDIRLPNRILAKILMWSLLMWI